ncbi:MAG: DUF2815 family protein [Peptococcaceae bacterium]|nr:DUF2815 family protein [Peptococcaceae bacterium]
MSNQQPNPTNVTTGQVRLSYVHLFKPYANQPGQEPKYSVTILLPKSDIATKQRIDAAIQSAIQQGINSKWNGVRPPHIKTPIWDGDGVRQNGEPFGPECKGHWVFTASSKQQPAVVDTSIQPILNQSEVYSGIYARVNINFFPFNTNGNRGIGCGLGPVQKLADGEPLGGQITAEAAFGDSPPLQPQPPQPQQVYQQPAAPQYASSAYQQPVYQQPRPIQAPVYPQGYPQAAPSQIDPITGKPITGGIMGL